MSLHYHQTTTTPDEILALSVAVQTIATEVGARRAACIQDRTELSYADQYLLSSCDTALRWLSHVESELYEEWRALPEGHAVRAAYEDRVWTWDDQDLAAMPETDPADLVGFARPTRPAFAD